MLSVLTEVYSRNGLILLFILLTSKVVHSELQFVLSRNVGSWTQSSASCKSIRGSLAILDNIELQRSFDRDVKPNPGESVWVGRYVGYSSIVTIDGCYRNKSLTIRRSKVLVNNYLVTCLRECTDTTYIGMQGQLCYCMDSITPQAMLVPGVYCRSDCPGENIDNSANKMSGCGQSDPAFDTVSVYRKVRQDEISLDINAPNQGECIAYNTRANKWQPLDCSQQKLFTCDRLQCQGPPAMCVLESTNPATWFQARTSCEGTNSLLATVNLTTNSYFRQKVISGDPMYWTGLHRKQITAWSYDTNSKIIQQSDRCFAAVKQPTGMWKLVMDWCSNEHRYACVQDLKPTTVPTGTPPTTLIPVTVSSASTRSTTSPASTTDSLPTVDPFATPLGVKSAAARLSPAISWYTGSAVTWFTSTFVAIFQLVYYDINVRGLI